MLSADSRIFFRNGALLIHKPAGVTSFDVIRQLQRDLCDRLKVTRKNLPSMGHTGTLDPFATGLLMVCVGRAVKLVQYLTGCQKTYSGTICFGVQTDTADRTGTVTGNHSVPDTLQAIQSAAATFVGTRYDQIPPMYSAKQIDGERLYKLARAGKTVERSPQVCAIEQFQIGDFTPPHARFLVTCSAGTYVRTLAEDLAQRLGTVAHVAALHRESIGAWHCAEAIALEQAAAWLMSDTADGAHWIPFDQLLDHYPSVAVDQKTAQSLIAGQQACLAPLLATQSTDVPTVALMIAGRILAIVAPTPDGWRLQRVFPDVLTD